MKKLKAFFALSAFLFSINAFSKISWKEYVYSKLPEPIRFIKIKTDLKSVEKNIGKAQLVEKNKHYYELEGFKYSLEIIYQNKGVKEFSYTFMGNRPSIDTLELETAKLTSYLPTGKSGGRFLKFEDKDGEIIIDAVSKNIYSVRIRK